jgi:hypothetical protein
MKITKAFLEIKDACAKQVVLFNKVFPKGTLLTKAALKKAAKACLNINWLLYYLLDAGGSRREIYSSFARSIRKADAEWGDKTRPMTLKYMRILRSLEWGSARYKRALTQYRKVVRKDAIDYYLKILPVVHRYLKKGGFTDD